MSKPIVRIRPDENNETNNLAVLKIKANFRQVYEKPFDERCIQIDNRLIYDPIMTRFRIQPRPESNYAHDVADFLLQSNSISIFDMPGTLNLFKTCTRSSYLEARTKGAKTDIMSLFWLFLRRNRKYFSLPKFNIVNCSMFDFFQNYAITEEDHQNGSVSYRRYIDTETMCSLPTFTQLHNGLETLIKTGIPVIIYATLTIATILYKVTLVDGKSSKTYEPQNGEVHQICIVYQKVDDHVVRHIVDTSTAIKDNENIKTAYDLFIKCITQVEKKFESNSFESASFESVSFVSDDCITNIQGDAGVCAPLSMIIALIVLKNLNVLQHETSLFDICESMHKSRRSKKSHKYLLQHLVGEMLSNFSSVLSDALKDSNFILENYRKETSPSWDVVAKFHLDYVKSVVNNVLHLKPKSLEAKHLKVTIDNLNLDSLRKLL